MECRIYGGVGVNKLAAAGRLHFLLPKEPETRDEPFRGEAVELSEFADAVLRARKRTAALRRRTALAAGEEAAQIFEIHDMLLADEDFTEGVKSAIKSGQSASAAVRTVSERMAAVFDAMNDEYFAARAADMRDVGKRVIEELSGGADAIFEDAVIIVSPDLSPGDTAALDTEKVLGLVTFGGTLSSHTAILARALGIPAIVRTGEIPKSYEGAQAILDAEGGRLIIDPEPRMLLDFANREKERRLEQNRLKTLISLPCVTRSGKRIGLFANIGSVAEARSAHREGAEGIGLFRSEFLFLGRDSLPSEEEQYEAYSEVARIMSDKEGPVVVRTLDAGSDKVIPALGGEAEINPALGVRGIRRSFANVAVFKTQLRALCRASAHGKIAIMLPMVVSADELCRARSLLFEVRNELRFEGVSMAERIPFGIMIETPAAAIMARELAKEADFFSVGTNDLCQYTFAADRQNGSLAAMFEGERALEPVFRLISHAAESIHASGGGKWIGICGELAADTELCARFIASGADELSVSPPYLLPLKEKIRSVE